MGGHLVSSLQSLPYEVTWWRERQDEVDFVVRGGRLTWAVEVKSGRPGRRLSGLGAFKRIQPKAIPVVLGSGGLPLGEFFARDPKELLASLA